MPFFKAEFITFDVDAQGYKRALKAAIRTQVKIAARKFYEAAIPHIPIRTGFVRGSWDNLGDLVGGSAQAESDTINILAQKLKRLVARSRRPDKELVFGQLHAILARNPGFKLRAQHDRELAQAARLIKKLLEHKSKAFAKRKGPSPSGGPESQIEILKAGRERGIRTGMRPFVFRRTPRGYYELRFAKKEYYYPGDGRKILKSRETGRDFGIKADKILEETRTGYNFNFNSSITYFRINEFYPGHAPTAPWQSLQAGRTAFMTYLRTVALKKLPRIQDFFLITRIAVTKQRLTHEKYSNVTKDRVTRDSLEE
jgi:hypothetical protein